MAFTDESLVQPLDPRRYLATATILGNPFADRVTIQMEGAYTLRVVVSAKLHHYDIRKIDRVNLSLGAGNDRVTFVGTPPANVRWFIDGAGGNDTLVGGPSHDTLVGGEGVDYLTDGAGNDSLDGGGGDDHLFTSAGRDSVTGGSGRDLITVLSGNAGFTDDLYGNTGDDTIQASAGAIRAYGNDGNDTLVTTGAGSTLYGGAGHDSIVGGPGNDLLNGGFGNDSLKGNAGNDTLWGGEDDDHLSGGAGRDEFHAGSGNDALRSIDEVFGEIVDGGSGIDIAYVDRDKLTGRTRDYISAIEKLV